MGGRGVFFWGGLKNYKKKIIIKIKHWIDACLEIVVVDFGALIITIICMWLVWAGEGEPPIWEKAKKTDLYLMQNLDQNNPVSWLNFYVRRGWGEGKKARVFYFKIFFLFLQIDCARYKLFNCGWKGGGEEGVQWPSGLSHNFFFKFFFIYRTRSCSAKKKKSQSERWFGNKVTSLWLGKPLKSVFPKPCVEDDLSHKSFSFLGLKKCFIFFFFFFFSLPMGQQKRGAEGGSCRLHKKLKFPFCLDQKSKSSLFFPSPLFFLAVQTIRKVWVYVIHIHPFPPKKKNPPPSTQL